MHFTIMKMQVFTLSALIFWSCQSPEQTAPAKSKNKLFRDSTVLALDVKEIDTNVEHEFIEEVDTCNTTWESKYETYSEYKAACKQLKSRLKAAYQNTPDSLKDEKLLDISMKWGKIMAKQGIPFWLGTPWTFEGHTATPNEGTVACGYLVSTLLAHSGLNINRYYLAQQSAYNGGKTLNCTGEKPVRYYLNNIYEHIDTLPEGLYSVGLAYHVGYLWKEGKGSYFIHSNYILEEGVVIEHAKCSYAFNSSNLFLIVPISGNLKLTKKWLFSEKIEVIRS